MEIDGVFIVYAHRRNVIDRLLRRFHGFLYAGMTHCNILCLPLNLKSILYDDIIRFRLRLQPIPIFLLAFIAFITLHAKYRDRNMQYPTGLFLYHHNLVSFLILHHVNNTNSLKYEFQTVKIHEYLYEKMNLIEQKDKLDITNVDVQIEKKPSKHGSLLPDNIRAILVGPSGSGKTNIIHSGASSVFYLAQTYSKIPKQLVRDNSNFLIILKQDDTNLRLIFNDHSSTDMDFIEFRKISHLCWNHKKVLLENLITSKKNIKRKLMEMKRGIIDSDNYFREAFKPIIEPLSNQTEKITQPADEIKPETSDVSDDDNDNELNSSFSNFFNKRPTSKRYDKSYGMYYDKASDSYKIGGHSVTFSHGNLQLFNKYYPWTEGLWSLLCEKEPKNTTLWTIWNFITIF
ncbi:hypothetical protein AGLY_015872 [Aphis glycines]|uniref:DUF8207 domain-containing protein n=1 Tax=Aphis glycines TaxID=307491 RepID=A0A6G0T1D2_APHGL|nr:hypothetical protein AGLY_015872 [Aphis glycines]